MFCGGGFLWEWDLYTWILSCIIPLKVIRGEGRGYGGANYYKYTA
jgi:hypothetical protein